MGYYTSKSSLSMISYLSHGIETEPNLLTHVDSIFTQHSEFAPDILMLIDGHPPAVVLEEEFGERTIVGSQDFLPIEGMDSYKLLTAICRRLPQNLTFG